MIEEFVEEQLAVWPEAKQRYDALREVKQRRMALGELTVGVQFNPARAVSTAAPVDTASIKARPCFLCGDFRPEPQIGVPIAEGWTLLLNPFPIFPIHLTIASDSHRPQDGIPAEAAAFAEKLPGMTVFYNGARAGASAPDHMHLQAVLTAELPLMNLVMARHTHTMPPLTLFHPKGDSGINKGGASINPGGAEIHTGFETKELDIPFPFFSAIITPDLEGMKTLVTVLGLTGTDKQTGKPDPGLVNAYFWTERPGGLLRIVVVPRSAHRPPSYPEPLVSPGAIDMAGVMITPRLKDFEVLSDADILDIYKSVTTPN